MAVQWTMGAVATVLDKNKYRAMSKLNASDDKAVGWGYSSKLDILSITSTCNIFKITDDL